MDLISAVEDLIDFIENGDKSRSFYRQDLAEKIRVVRRLIRKREAA